MQAALAILEIVGGFIVFGIGLATIARLLDGFWR